MVEGSSKCMGTDYINTIKLYFYKISEAITLNVEIFCEKFPHLLLPQWLVYDAYKVRFKINFKVFHS